MKITVTLVALCLAWPPALAKSTETSAQRKDAGNTDKRATLAEGNSGLNKRAPLLGSPGVEYADTTESLPDKSPPQQVYATPVPQISKFSDVLTGHGPSFSTAIANHLYSPLQVYQPLAKVDTPTYQVSAPVPSQLAYSEHRTFYPGPPAPQTNGIQYYHQPQRIFYQPPQIYTQQPSNFARATALSYAAPQQQVQYFQQPSQFSSVPQQLIAFSQPQPGYFHQELQPGVAYTQTEQSNPSDTRPQTFTQSQPQPSSAIAYGQSQNLPERTGVTFLQALPPAPLQFATSQTSYTAPGVIPKPIQRNLNAQPINVIDKNSDVDNQAIKNEVKAQSGGGALSYASFSQSTAGNQAPTLQNVYLPSAPKTATFIPKTLPTNVNYISTAAKAQTAPGYGSIGQQIGQPVVGYYQQPTLYHAAPQQVFAQEPAYQVAQHGYVQQNLPAAAPTFPAVQYFGKFAQNLFGGYAH